MGDFLTPTQRSELVASRASGENIEIEKFLTRDDLNAFTGKVVFCMSCDSNELAQASLDAGAIGFVGFDKIPFNRFNDAEEPIGSHVLVKHCQEKLIAPAITAVLERFLTGRASLDEAVDYLRLWITKNAVAYVRQYTSVKERREVAATVGDRMVQRDLNALAQMHLISRRHGKVIANKGMIQAFLPRRVDERKRNS